MIEFIVIIKQDESGTYIASVPELPGCHTQADTLEELDKNIKEVIELYLEFETERKFEKDYSLISVKQIKIDVNIGVQNMAEKEWIYIDIDDDVKAELDKLKLKDDESYNSVLKRFFENRKNKLVTIQIGQMILDRLDKFKKTDDESYASVLDRIIKYVEEDQLTDEEYEEAMRELEAGEAKSHEEFWAEILKEHAEKERKENES